MTLSTHFNQHIGNTYVEKTPSDLLMEVDLKLTIQLDAYHWANLYQTDHR